MDKPSSGVVEYPPVGVGMTLEELNRAEAEARRLRADPLVRFDIRIRRSEQRVLDEYTTALGFESRAEAARNLLRDALIRWKQGGEHGGL